MKEYERGFHILRHKAPSEAFLIHVLQRNISNVAASQRNCSKLVSTQDTAPWLPGRHAKRVLPCYQFGTFQHSNRKVWLMLKFHIVLVSRMLDTYHKAKQSSLGLQKSLTAKCQSQFLVGLQLRSRRQSICNL